MTTAIQPQGVQAALMQAVESKDPRMLELILAAREKWQADEARAAFNAAVVRFQQRVAIIAKLDKAYDKLYARMDRIWREVRPLLEECGLAVTWESVRTTADSCTLDGHLRHIAGHAQPLHHEMPAPDLLKGQNAAQRAGSAETYAKRYALMACLGIQVGEDIDGNARPTPPANESRIAYVRDLIAKTNTDTAKVLKHLGVRDLSDATADQIEQVAAQLARKVAT